MTADDIRLTLGPWLSQREAARAIRLAVFVEEQGIPVSIEWDEWDEPSLHCVAWLGDRPIGTGRLLPDGHIGRMAVLAEGRRLGVGGRILGSLVEAARSRGDAVAMLSAQRYVQAFYERHGFTVEGDPYMEAGIEHVAMRRELTMPVTVSEARVRRPDGCSLVVREWRPARTLAGPARGVYLFHGLGEHSNRYEAVARWFVARGWRVRAHDHRGHGASEGFRGAMNTDTDLVDDAEALLQAFADQLGAPPVLLGHSLGGTLAAEVALRAKVPLAGLILSSPGLDPGLNVIQKGLLATMSRLAPDMALGNGLDPARISHDPAVVAAYRDDSLVHDRVTARLVRWLVSSGAQSIAQAGALLPSTVLLVAGDDRLVNPEGSRRFAQAAPAGRVTMHWYPELWHELFNEAEPARSQVLADLGRWLDALPGAPSIKAVSRSA